MNRTSIRYSVLAFIGFSGLAALNVHLQHYEFALFDSLMALLNGFILARR